MENLLSDLSLSTKSRSCGVLESHLKSLTGTGMSSSLKVLCDIAGAFFTRGIPNAPSFVEFLEAILHLRQNILSSLISYDTRRITDSH